MFEIGVVSIVALAVGYWVTLWLIGRHDDVLHGDFVHEEDGAEAPAEPRLSVAEPFPPHPPFPKRSKIKPGAAGPAARHSLAEQPSQIPSRQTPTHRISAQPATPIQSEQSDTLQSLLASIKRDLKDASQL
jgi:hypothetical protein